MSFLNDLEEGRLYEIRILNFLTKSYPIMRLVKNPSSLGVDLVSEYWTNVEVKFDRRMDTTWNIFIEYECNGKPSGIFKYDYIHFFAYWNNNRFYLFNWNKLKKDISRLIKTNEYRLVTWWDGWRVKWILIPEKDLIPKQIAARSFSNF